VLFITVDSDVGRKPCQIIYSLESSALFLE